MFVNCYIKSVTQIKKNCIEIASQRGLKTNFVHFRFVLNQ